MLMPDFRANQTFDNVNDINILPVQAKLKTKSLLKTLWLLACGLAISAATASLGQAETNSKVALGPWLSRFPLTLDEGERTEALGPLFYSEQKETQHTFAIPPFFSHVLDPSVESEEYDYLYPFLSYDRFGKEYRWHLFQLFAFAGGQNQEEVPVHRFTLFPVYFQQRSPDTNLEYTAVFPIYGHLKNRLFRDEVFFIGFPGYMQTRKRDVITDNYVYPFYHKRHGDGLEGWQIWPFYGQEHKDLTARTNGFGDVEVIAGHDRTFIGWPIYFDHINGIGTENPERQFAVLPFYVSQRSPKRDSTTVMWPLVTWTDDRESKYRERAVPWPLIVFARGEGKTLNRVFPFYSKGHNKYVESNFYMWPIYKYNRLHSDPLDRERTRILLFLYSFVNEKNTETGKARTRSDLWPLFTKRTEPDGRTRFQMFAPLEPFLPLSKSIDRNWSPVWSVWRAENNPINGHTSKSLLWNVYRSETTPTTKKSSLLFGLFQYQSDSDTKRWRLFYIPMNAKKDSGHASEHR